MLLLWVLFWIRFWVSVFFPLCFFFFFEWGVHQRETGTGSRLIDSVLIEVITRLGIKAWGTGIEVMHLYIFVSV